MANDGLRFTLHTQCRQMLETYRRDDGIGQSALKSYERCAQLHVALGASLSGNIVKPADRVEPEPIGHVGKIIPLPSRPCRVSSAAVEPLESANILRVAFG